MGIKLNGISKSPSLEDHTHFTNTVLFSYKSSLFIMRNYLIKCVFCTSQMCSHILAEEEQFSASLRHLKQEVQHQHPHGGSVSASISLTHVPP